MSEQLCVHCNEPDCKVHCPDVPDGKHHPYISTGRFSTLTADHIVFEFNCRHCNQTGGVKMDKTNMEKIEWD